MNSRTAEDLWDALNGEAMAYAKYMLFAETARQQGYPALATLFEQTAQEEMMDHFHGMAELLEFGTSNTILNVQKAIAGEAEEVSHKYKKMQMRAEENGDKNIADFFAEVIKDEQKHLTGFTKALRELSL